MGIYVMEPKVLQYIPDERYFDFPDIVRVLLKANEPIGAYRYDGLWFDIGRQEDYAEAVAAWEANRSDNGHGPGGKPMRVAPQRGERAVREAKGSYS
jgi:NDP-sugar pyrophosphorylase family protein